MVRKVKAAKRGRAPSFVVKVRDDSGSNHKVTVKRSHVREPKATKKKKMKKQDKKQKKEKGMAGAVSTALTLFKQKGGRRSRSGSPSRRDRDRDRGGGGGGKGTTSALSLRGAVATASKVKKARKKAVKRVRNSAVSLDATKCAYVRQTRAN